MVIHHRSLSKHCHVGDTRTKVCPVGGSMVSLWQAVRRFLHVSPPTAIRCPGLVSVTMVAAESDSGSGSLTWGSTIHQSMSLGRVY